VVLRKPIRSRNAVHRLVLNEPLSYVISERRVAGHYSQTNTPCFTPYKPPVSFLLQMSQHPNEW